jgi:heme/copper-type cytochrome/quinol oxidase subunit 2
LLGPETAHSPNADDLNTLYWVTLAIAGILVVAINAALVAVVVRFRAARGREPRRLRTRRPAQLAAGGAFAALAIGLFIAGVAFTENASEVEASGPEGLQASSLTTAQRDIAPPSGDPGPLVIKATGQQWIWRYQYPDGTFSYYELVVPADTAVIVELGSTDVVHRWWVPGLGGKFDAVPGQGNKTWFKVDSGELGDDGEASFDGASYAFSGPAYAVMRTRVRVLGVPEYEAWLEQQAAGIQEAQAFVQQALGEAGQ